MLLAPVWLLVNLGPVPSVWIPASPPFSWVTLTRGPPPSAWSVLRREGEFFAPPTGAGVRIQGTATREPEQRLIIFYESF